MSNPSYPPLPITQQPINPYMSFQGLYLDNLPPVVNEVPNGDLSLSLQFLQEATTVRICQKLEIVQLATGFATENQYTILNETGQPVFYASEKSECCARQCCGPTRSMEIYIKDVFQNEVLHLLRPLACQMPCCWCCLQNMEIFAAPNTLISTITQRVSLKPRYYVNDPSGKPVLQIDGPFNVISCGKDITFSVKSIDSNEIGTITKKWGGFVAEAFTDADTFDISFQKDLSLNHKLAMISAVFLIDMMFYERKPKSSMGKNLLLGLISLFLYLYVL